MRVRIYSVVAGDAAAALSRITKPFAERFLGGSVTVVAGTDPYRAKLEIGAQVTAPAVLVDSDLLFLKPCDLSEPLALVKQRRISAALESQLSPFDHGGMVSYQYLRAKFLNTGLIVTGPSLRGVFERALQIYDALPADASVYYDEGPFNMAAHELKTSVNVLPQSMNRQVYRDPRQDGDTALHFSGAPHPMQRLLDVRRAALLITES